MNPAQLNGAISRAADSLIAAIEAARDAGHMVTLRADGDLFEIRFYSLVATAEMKAKSEVRK
jgi:hypothetical protein